MKRILLLLLLVVSLNGYTLEQTQSLIKDRDTQRIQLVFEVLKSQNADPDLWELIERTMLLLYTPQLESEEAIDIWLRELNKVIKTISAVSRKTGDAQTKVTIRFVTD